ncbi:uncharacterized protein LOC131946144 [Physella acuta]|uniref:uncharacterized protein LOC131946144 n=1 Tax=Physella acuta TaxID=109671 RepID=UPI0027DD569B|nr:uncharacterized protein LOC131946144 [Physella acuta]XP_059162790.1 uncharacterized protein LOC131946144 [Physella acuta]
MLTSTPLSLLTFIMESVQQLDPSLLKFWEGFPCPPPWKEELLFRLNWTGCVGVDVGERVKLYMADKCNIRHDGKKILLEPGDDKEAGGVMVEEDCALACQLIIGVVCVLFLVLLLVVVVFCVRRHRAKPSSPSHQSSLTAHPDNAKYYTSCHYACAPVVGRQLQTSLNGDRLETSILPPGANNGHYQPGMYPQHNCQQNYHLARHQPPRMINTPYGQVPAHTSSLVVPHHLRYYRKLDGAYSSSSISNSDRSPVYESIGDADSVRERARGRDASMSECEFCDCGGDHASDQSGYVGYQDPIILGDNVGHRAVYIDKQGRAYHDSGSLISPQPAEDPPGPCPPMYMDGYYGDKCPQTLPLRPLRGQGKRDEAGLKEYPDIEHDEISPLKNQPEGEGKSDGPTRRRPSSGSCYSNNSSIYREGNYGGQRRAIPALHPHYFVASPDEIS